MDIATHRVPQPRVSASAYEQGRTRSASVHAARKTLQGHQAVCDGGRIVEFVSGRFDAAAIESCPACVAAVSLTN